MTRRELMRKWIANKLAALARCIYPQSEEVMGFFADRMVEMAITGQSFVKITHIPPEDIIVNAAGIHLAKSAAAGEGDK